MKVALIIATTGRRKHQITKLLVSLAKQSHRNIEVIFALQGTAQIGPLLEPFTSQLDIKTLTTSKFGLAYARNLGAREARADILAFPDDDCHYAPDTIENALRHLHDNHCDLLAAGVYDGDSEQPFFRYPPKLVPMGAAQFWLAPSVSIFIKKNIFQQVNGFDEDFGLAAAWPSGEETDLIFRIHYHIPDARFLLDAGVKVFHKKTKRTGRFFAGQTERAFLRNKGWGALARKHLNNAPFYWSTKLAGMTAKKIAALLYYSLLHPRSHAAPYYYKSCLGLLAGFTAYHQKNHQKSSRRSGGLNH